MADPDRVGSSENSGNPKCLIDLFLQSGLCYNLEAALRVRQCRSATRALCCSVIRLDGLFCPSLFCAICLTHFNRLCFNALNSGVRGRAPVFMVQFTVPNVIHCKGFAEFSVTKAMIFINHRFNIL